MPAARKKRRASCLARRPLRARPRCEELESRDLLSSVPLLALSTTEFENNDTIDQAQDLRTLNVGQAAEVSGAVAPHSGVAADVDFYQFTLANPAQVRLSAVGARSQTAPQLEAGALSSVLTLYNSDPSDFIGHRLVAQDDGASHGGDALIDRSLARGTYFVAVSGTGNRYFHPFLPDSGYTGSEGPYTFSVAASDPLLPASAAPAVLAADPAPSEELPGSPDILRVTFSAPLDLASLGPGSTVRLLYSPTETFAGGGQ